MSKLTLDIYTEKYNDDLTVAELLSLIKLSENKFKLHKCITCEHMIKIRYKKCFECEYNIIECRDCRNPIHHKYPTCSACYEKSKN